LYIIKGRRKKAFTIYWNEIFELVELVYFIFLIKRIFELQYLFSLLKNNIYIFKSLHNIIHEINIVVLGKIDSTAKIVDLALLSEEIYFRN